jgi:hypothetical protein
MNSWIEKLRRESLLGTHQRDIVSSRPQRDCTDEPVLYETGQRGLKNLHEASTSAPGVEVQSSSTVRVYLSDFLSIPVAEPDTCPSCGKTQWWTKSSGQQVCGICHPNPHEKELVTDAA